MGIDQWWPKLNAEAREWLVANNGDVVPAWVLSEIATAGGEVDFGESGEDGFYLSDTTTDWIEETANDED